MWIPETEFALNLTFVDKFLEGNGYEMGCGCEPLMGKDIVNHFDISPQPKAVEKVGDAFIRADATALSSRILPKVNFIFSSHMVEDLPSAEAMIECLNNWSTLLHEGGFLVILIPDMQGGRYPDVASGSGNPSHKVDVGYQFMKEEVAPKLPHLKLVQIDTIPHDKSCTMDVVFERV